MKWLALTMTGICGLGAIILEAAGKEPLVEQIAASIWFLFYVGIDLVQGISKAAGDQEGKEPL